MRSSCIIIRRFGRIFVRVTFCKLICEILHVFGDFSAIGCDAKLKERVSSQYSSLSDYTYT
jgi:hypothetical protein